MVNGWIDRIQIVEPPPNHVSPEIRSLCSEFGLHSYLGVLCGWEWALEHKDQKIEYRIELVRGSSKQTVSTSNVKALNEVMKIYRR
jgi:hypothetical protein